MTLQPPLSDGEAVPGYGRRRKAQPAIADSVAGLSMCTVEPRTFDHTAVTVTGCVLFTWTGTQSVVGMRPVLGGFASL